MLWEVVAPWNFRNVQLSMEVPAVYDMFMGPVTEPDRRADVGHQKGGGNGYEMHWTGQEVVL